MHALEGFFQLKRCRIYVNVTMPATEFWDIVSRITNRFSNKSASIQLAEPG